MNKSELIESQKKLLADAQAVIKAAKTENRDLNGDEKDKVETLFAEADKITESVRSLSIEDRAARLEASLREPVRQTAEVRSLDHGDEANDLYTFASGQRGKVYQANRLEVRSLSKLSNAAGNYTVKTTLADTLEKTLRYYFQVEQAVSVFSTSTGEPYSRPTVDDTSNTAAIYAENAQVGSDTKNPTFGQITWKRFDYYSDIVPVSHQLIQDSSVDIPSVLADLFAERMGVARDVAVVSANSGTTAPEGLLYGVSVGANLASGNAITPAKLIDLETAVPIQYRSQPGVGYVMHDATWQYIRGLVDTTGRFLVNSDLQNGVEKKLLGYPVYISNQMTSISSPGDNQPLILFGLLSKYNLRLIGGPKLSRFDDAVYGQYGQVGFMLNQAWDGRWLTKAGVRTLNSFDS